MKRSVSLFLVIFFIIFGFLPTKAVSAAIADEQGVSVKYKGFIEGYGWSKNIYDGQMLGTTGRSMKLEGINISLENPLPGMKIRYQAHVQDIGWQGLAYDGSMAGTAGKSLRMEAIKIVLEGAPAGYHIQYQAHVQNIGWQDWVQDGQLAGTTGKSLRVEALKIRIVKDGSALTGGMGIKYKADIAEDGWQDNVYDGQIAGTQGRSQKIEGINVSLVNVPQETVLKYQAHVESIGWQAWVNEGQLAGTNGQLRLEAVKMQLEGAPEWLHVKYQAHVQDIGWQPWVSDGEIAGTTGKSLRMEALRIKLIDTRNGTEVVQNIPVVNYVSYDLSLNNMVDKQLTVNPAIQTLSSNNQWEWRYASMQYGQPGYFVYIPRVGTDGTTTVDASGNIQYDIKWTNSPTDYEAIKQALIKSSDPSNITTGNTLIYQFLKLSYIDGTTAEQLNSKFNPNGVLAGKGQVFIDAAKKYNINPIYLAAHAILETANGTSNLAVGIPVNGVKVHNLFGIQAFDDNPDYYGSNYAYQKGWTSVDAAIVGGAQWIAGGYISNPSYKQDTLYKMRWNPVNPGVHQYASDIGWAVKQTAYIKKCFDLFKDAKLTFEIPVFK